MSTETEYLTVKQVAALLHLEPATVTEYLRNGKLIGHRLGGDGPWRVTRTDVDLFAQGRETNVGSESETERGNTDR